MLVSKLNMPILLFLCGFMILPCVLSTNVDGPVDPTDAIIYGKFQIVNCHSKNVVNEAHDILDALISINLVIDHAVEDMDSLKSPYGFYNFFKFNTAIKHVKEIFQDIKTSKEIPAQVPETKGGPVTFLCIWPDDPYTQKTYDDICTKFQEFGAEAIYGSWTYGMKKIYYFLQVPFLTKKSDGQYIFICPILHILKTRPTPAYCPAVAGTRSYPNDDRLTRTKFGFLTQALAHTYLGEAYGLENAVKVQDAIWLNPFASLRNPPSYAFYLSGESSENGIPQSKDDRPWGSSNGSWLIIHSSHRGRVYKVGTAGILVP